MLIWNVTVNLPDTLTHAATPFEDKEYTSEWIALLPLAASGRAAADIHGALRDVVAHDLSYKKRLFLLEQTSQIIASLTQGLTQEIYQGGVPLNPNTTEKAKRLLGVLALKVVGYRQVLGAVATSPFAGGLFQRRLVGLCMLRVMELLGQMFELYRHASVPVAHGLWQLFNRYYAIAEQDGQLDVLPQSLDKGANTSIAAVFKTQILLESLNYHDLQQFELKQARVLVDSLCDDVLISRSDDADGPSRFCFRIDEDLPPSRFATERWRQCQECEQRRILNLESLLAKLENMQRHSDSLGSTVSQSASAANQIVIRKLQEGWRVTDDHRETRTDNAQMIRAAHGLSNIALVLAAKCTLHGGEAEDARTGQAVDGSELADEFGDIDVQIEGIDPLLHEEHLRLNHDQWSVTPYAITEKGGWTDNVQRRGGVVIDVCLDNESPGGFGVSIPVSEGGAAANYKVGELMSLNLEQGWALTTIRWVRMEAERTSLGLSRLGSEIRPYSMVQYRDDNESQPLPVLLIRDRGGHPAVVLHKLSTRDKPELGISGMEGLSLRELLETTPSFSCFRIDEASYTQLQGCRGLVIEDDEELPEEDLDALWRQLRQDEQQHVVTDYVAFPDDGFERLAARTTKNTKHHEGGGE